MIELLLQFNCVTAVGIDRSTQMFVYLKRNQTRASAELNRIYTGNCVDWARIEFDCNWRPGRFAWVSFYGLMWLLWFFLMNAGFFCVVWVQSSRTDGSLKRIAASPVPSDGRLTPRRSQGQYTSYVLITQEKAAKVHAVNEQVDYSLSFAVVILIS